MIQLQAQRKGQFFNLKSNRLVSFPVLWQEMRITGSV